MASSGCQQRIIPGLARILKYCWPQLRGQRLLVAGSMLALIAQVAFRILEPWPLKFVIDAIIAPGQQDNLTGSSQATLLLAASAGAVVLIAVLRAWTDYCSRVGFALAGHRVLAQIRGQLYRHLQYLSLSFHARARSGDLVQRLVGDVGMLREAVVTAFLPLLAKLFILVGMAGLMFWLSWQLALVALATLPLFWIPTVRLTRRIHSVARLQRKRRGSLAAIASESIGAIHTVQAFSLQDQLTESLIKSDQGTWKEGVKAKRLQAKLRRTVAWVVAVATGLVLYFGAKLVLSGALTAGELVVFLYYLKSSFKPVQDFSKYSSRLAKATAAGERILDVLERVPEVQDLPGARLAPSFRGAVRFEQVHFSYDSHPVLEGVDFEVETGETVALVGASGSGKSTLASLLLRLYDPLSGRVLIDGHDLRELTLKSLRSQISVVLQDNLLFAGSIRENIAIGVEASLPEIEAAARLANAEEFILRLPEGYETLVGERGTTLSNGQRQRIAIARAAIRKNPILILDEPTSDLDEENSRAVVGALERLLGDTTTFVITHDLRLAARADRILCLESGQISEQGSHRDLLQRGGGYARLHRQQMLWSGRLERPSEELNAVAH